MNKITQTNQIIERVRPTWNRSNPGVDWCLCILWLSHRSPHGQSIGVHSLYTILGIKNTGQKYVRNVITQSPHGQSMGVHSLYTILWNQEHRTKICWYSQGVSIPTGEEARLAKMKPPMYVTWSRGMSRMSEMLFRRYWQKQCSNSFVLYCF